MPNGQLVTRRARAVPIAALLTLVGGILRDVSGAHGAPLLLAGALELAAIAVLAFLRLSQRRDRTAP